MTIMKGRTRGIRGVAITAASLLISYAALGASLSSRDAIQEPPSKAPDPTRERDERKLDRLIEMLGDDTPEERETATEEIRKIGAGAVPQLKQALKITQDAEMRSRIRSLLWELDLPDPAAFFSCRREGRENSRALLGSTRATEGAVLAALKWLARHQNPDGSWSAEGFGDRCPETKCAGPGEKDHDTGVTSLALLAFLGAGYVHESRDEYPDPIKKDRILKFGEVVRSALKWLISRQDREGCVGGRGQKYNYSHAIATLALAEAYGMTAADFLKAPAQKSADFLVAGQNQGKGWRYSSRCGDNDSSVTAWAVMALTSAKISSLQVPKKAYDGAIAWFDEVTEKEGHYQVGYNAKGTGKVYVPGKNEQFDHHPSMSAAAVASRIFIERRKTAPELVATYLMMSDLPEWKESRIDFYYWYYGSLAVFQYDGPGGEKWKRWNAAMINALVPNQKTGKDGCQSGSWAPSVDRWGFEGGRVCATAMNALTLGIYHRYPIISEMR